MRPSSEELVAAFCDGARREGATVTLLGLVSTDLVYYAAGKLDSPAAMFTASHNPARYNGIKLCLAGARPVGLDTGLADIKEMAEAILDGRFVLARQPSAACDRSTCSMTSPTTSCPSSTGRSSSRST